MNFSCVLKINHKEYALEVSAPSYVYALLALKKKEGEFENAGMQFEIFSIKEGWAFGKECCMKYLNPTRLPK